MGSFVWGAVVSAFYSGAAPDCIRSPRVSPHCALLVSRSHSVVFAYRASGKKVPLAITPAGHITFP